MLFFPAFDLIVCGVIVFYRHIGQVNFIPFKSTAIRSPGSIFFLRDELI